MKDIKQYYALTDDTGNIACDECTGQLFIYETRTEARKEAKEDDEIITVKIEEVKMDKNDMKTLAAGLIELHTSGKLSEEIFDEILAITKH